MQTTARARPPSTPPTLPLTRSLQQRKASGGDHPLLGPHRQSPVAPGPPREVGATPGPRNLLAIPRTPSTPPPLLPLLTFDPQPPAHATLAHAHPPSSPPPPLAPRSAGFCVSRALCLLGGAQRAQDVLDDASFMDDKSFNYEILEFMCLRCGPQPPHPTQASAAPFPVLPSLPRTRLRVCDTPTLRATSHVRLPAFPHVLFLRRVTDAIVARNRNTAQKRCSSSTA